MGEGGGKVGCISLKCVKIFSCFYEKREPVSVVKWFKGGPGGVGEGEGF